MLDLSLAFSIAGLASIAYRFKVWHAPQRAFPHLRLTSSPKVTILIPCRNEEANLPSLISSLKGLTYPDLEIIVIDDSSTDSTYELARELLKDHLCAKVLRAPVKPSSWGGKNWPCWVGAEHATGDLLLFTDADTIHAPGSLHECMAFFQERQLDLLSAVPYHACKKTWERFLGLFLLLPFIATAFKDSPHPKRLFAIGQYLLFSKSSYFELGGHQAVASSLAEDIDLATLWMNKGKRYGVFSHPGMYQVQMYPSFKKFMAGWQRLLRLGLRRSTLLSFLEITFVCYMYCFSLFERRFDLLLVFILGLAILLSVQKRFGRFSAWGLVLAPISVLLFVALTALALTSALFQKEITWHGRSYSGS